MAGDDKYSLNGRPLPLDYAEALPIIEERYKVLGRFMNDISGKISALSLRNDERFDTLERALLKTVNLQELHSTRVAEVEKVLPAINVELHNIREGYAHLHALHQDTSAKYSSHLNWIGTLYQQLEAKAKARDERQERIDANLETIMHIEQREDKHRYAWRLMLLFAIFLSLGLWAIEKI
jgi:hypothetical protein